MSVAEATSGQDAFRRVSYAVPGGVIAGIAFGDPTRPVDILYIHATGMNAMSYRRLLAPLGERFHVVAVDARGHGLTQLPTKLWSYTSWNRHRDDMIALIDAHMPGPVTLAGHSMGATTSLLIAGKRPDLVRALALIDPVIMPDARYRLFELPFMMGMAMRNSPMVRGALRRRARFPSKADAVAALTGRGFFKTFPKEFLEDYVEDGFAPDKTGGVKLTCTPQFEAATFSAQRHDPWRALANFTGPLVVLRAEIGSTCPPSVAQRVKEARPDARMAVLEGATHALPMERPDRVRAAIETAALMGHKGPRFADLD